MYFKGNLNLLLFIRPHQEHKPKFETTYPSEEEATYLYKLWYGKGPEKSNGY